MRIGLPYKMQLPKRPKNPFFKFRDENFKLFQQKYPHLRGIQVVPMIAQAFHKLPAEEREKYEKVYWRELEEYKVLKKNYDLGKQKEEEE